MVVVPTASCLRCHMLLPLALLLRQLLLERGTLILLHLRRWVLLVLAERASIEQRR